MKYKTLFRLALKVVGIVFFARAGDLLVDHFVILGTGYLFGNSSGVGSWSLHWTNLLLSIPRTVFPLAVGLYLFFGAKWIVDKAIPSNRPYCPNCGYDLTGAASGRCPECGTPFRPEDVRPPCVDGEVPTEPDA